MSFEFSFASVVVLTFDSVYGFVDVFYVCGVDVSLVVGAVTGFRNE